MHNASRGRRRGSSPTPQEHVTRGGEEEETTRHQEHIEPSQPLPALGELTCLDSGLETGAGSEQKSPDNNNSISSTDGVLQPPPSILTLNVPISLRTRHASTRMPSVGLGSSNPNGKRQRDVDLLRPRHKKTCVTSRGRKAMKFSIGQG